MTSSGSSSNFTQQDYRRIVQALNVVIGNHGRYMTELSPQQQKELAEYKEAKEKVLEQIEGHFMVYSGDFGDCIKKDCKKSATWSLGHICDYCKKTPCTCPCPLIDTKKVRLRR
jgi:hypothetical protein